MREIKFRVWDRKKKQFDTCRNSGDFMSFSLDYKGIYSLSIKGYKIYQQYTGLKDKNEKEIYEGDYLEGLGYIKFINGEYMIITNGTKPNLKFVSYHTYSRVIGNIYQNSELLK